MREQLTDDVSELLLLARFSGALADRLIRQAWLPSSFVQQRRR
jgi:hypothetical protein